jgi:hypothetical protein
MKSALCRSAQFHAKQANPFGGHAGGQGTKTRRDLYIGQKHHSQLRLPGERTPPNAPGGARHTADALVPD